MGLLSFIRQIRGYSDDRNSKTRVPMLKLWGEYWLSSQNANRSETFKKVSEPQYTDGSYLYSDTNLVSAYFTIDGYPISLVKDYKETIRSCVLGFPRVRVSFIDTYEPDTINWESPQVKAVMRRWSMVAEEESGQTNAYNIQEKVVGNQARGHREESIEYLAKALQTRQRHLFRVRTMMVITGIRGEMFDKAIHAVVEHCRQIGIMAVKVDDDLETYMRTYSPFSLAYQSSLMREVGNPSMTDEILAQMYSYTQGKVGEKGKYWGIDVESGFCVLKELKEKPQDPENILITGQTGSGKSFYAKAMILQLLCDSRFYGTIMDYEGTEYGPLVAFVKHGEKNKDNVVVLNMGSGSGAYFDPVPICFTSALGRSDAFTEENNPYQMARTYTYSLASIICCGQSAPNDWEQNIIDNAITGMYMDAGVTPNPSTWIRSQNMSIKNLYKQFEKLYGEYQGALRKAQMGMPLTRRENNIVSEGYRTAMEKMYFNITTNLGPNARTALFDNPIRLETIIKAKLVVCSFGMMAKSSDSMSPLELAMLSNSAAIISHIRSIYSKAQGKLNFKVWEEFQRWSILPGSVQTIKVALTGGRKLGDVNIVITNDIKSVLKDDPYALIDSLTSMAIGLIGDNETRDMIIKKWPELEPMRGSLDKIASIAETEGHRKKKGLTNSKYDKAFLVFLDRKVATVSKMYLPDGLAMSDIFKTAVEVKEDSDKKRKEIR